MSHPASTPITRLGLQIPNFTYPGVPGRGALRPRLRDRDRPPSAPGFDSVWVMDHLYQIAVIGPPTNAMFEAYTLLGGIAARTSSVRLGTLVTGVTYRNPALLAKIVTSLDVISSGRAILGIGSAWNEEEHRGYGFEFPPARERFERLTEAVQICRLMFLEDAPSFEGAYYRVDEVLNIPRPVTPGWAADPDRRKRREVDAAARRRARRRLQPVRRSRHDPAQALRARGALRRDRKGPFRDHEDAPRRPADRARRRRGRGEARAVRREPGGDARRRRARYAVVGDPDASASRSQAFLDAGLDGLMFNMPDAHDLEPVELAGKTLAPRLAWRIGRP